MKLKKSPSFIG